MKSTYNMIEKWTTLLENTNAYTFGEGFDEELFSEAMKGAFQVYDAFYYMEKISVEGFDETVTALDVMRLTSLMSEYMADRYTTEEGNEKFRASQLAVRLMLGRFTNGFQWHADGVFPVYELECYYCEDDELVYNVDKGDLSDMMKALQWI